MKRILLILLLAAPALLCAQEFVFQPEYDTVPVQMNGWDLFCPWVGGFTDTAPDFCDIDADGDLDLFLGHYFGDVKFFRNTGGATSPDFASEPGLSDSLRTFDGDGRCNPDFYDLDADGDLDALIGSGFVTLVWNQGSSTLPNFSTTPIQLFDSTGNWVFGTHVTLCDIDTDGDGDLICGEYQGHLQFYRNVGTPDSFAFYLEDDHWLDVDVGTQADPTFCDIDGNGTMDLFIGDDLGQIYFYRNIGTPRNFRFTLVSQFYANIDVGDKAAPEFADIDADGDLDLFVGMEYNGDMRFYRNTGTSRRARFEFVTQNYLTIDLGGNGHPGAQMVDIDADGDLDMILANQTLTGSLYLFENTGSNANPVYHLSTTNFQNVTIPSLVPTFGDLDGDGDLDLICGEGAIPGPPNIWLYVNQGTPGHPNFALYSSTYITNPDFFAHLKPVLADIDADGDLDLFVQDGDNDFLFYQNVGGPSWPNFTLITSQWQGIHQFPYPANDGYNFSFGDMDGDNDLDLLMGGPEQDNLYFYRNHGTPQVPQMVFETEEFFNEPVQYIYAPSLADLDQDGDLDLFVGDDDAGLYLYRNITPQVGPLPVFDNLKAGLRLSLSPNPANPLTVASFELRVASHVSFKVYDTAGRLVTTLVDGWRVAGAHEATFDASGLPSGIYFAKLTAADYSKVQKLVLMK